MITLQSLCEKYKCDPTQLVIRYLDAVDGLRTMEPDEVYFCWNCLAPESLRTGAVIRASLSVTRAMTAIEMMCGYLQRKGPGW